MALAALALVVFGAYDSYPLSSWGQYKKCKPLFLKVTYEYEGESGGERDLVIFEDKPINNHINEKVSSRALCRYGYS